MFFRLFHFRPGGWRSKMNSHGPQAVVEGIRIIASYQINHIRLFHIKTWKHSIPIPNRMISYHHGHTIIILCHIIWATLIVQNHDKIRIKSIHITSCPIISYHSKRIKTSHITSFSCSGDRIDSFKWYCMMIQWFNFWFDLVWYGMIWLDLKCNMMLRLRIFTY